MTQPAKAQEPSMEEILASIRRIIADDETSKAPAKPPAPTVAAAPPSPVPPRPAAMPPHAAEPEPVSPPWPPITQNQVDDMLAKLDVGQGQAPAEPEPSDILDLTEQMAAPAAEPEPTSFQTIDGEPDVIFTDQAPPQAEPPRAVAEPRLTEPPPAPIDRSLLSSSTSAAVDSAFNALAQTVLVQNARTLEDLVREMLRPMLKSWLDDNLPGLVERIVKAEIERVSRGHG
jgi:cell pole-organizing protein PopZ